MRRGCNTTGARQKLASEKTSGEDSPFRNVQRFRGGLVFEAQRLLYHSTLGLRVIKKNISLTQYRYYQPSWPRS